MPMNYQFLKADGEAANLNDVDREICAITGETYSEKKFCNGFQMLATCMSLSVLRTCKGCSPTSEEFEAWVAKNADLPDSDPLKYETEWVDLAREFYIKRYRFNLWRSV